MNQTINPDDFRMSYSEFVNGYIYRGLGGLWRGDVSYWFKGLGIGYGIQLQGLLVSDIFNSCFSEILNKESRMLSPNYGLSVRIQV